MKKRYLIISLIVLSLTISGCGKKETEVKGNDAPPVTEQNKEELTFKNEITIELKGELPSNEDYILSGKVEDNANLTYRDSKEKVVNVDTSIIGTYSVYLNDKKISTLNVVDTTAPILKLKNITIDENKKYKVNDFVESCEDNSEEECSYSFLEEKMGQYTKAGTYDITIIAKDKSNNETKETAKLTIKKKATTGTTNNNQNNNNSTNGNNNNSNNTNTNKNETTNDNKNETKYPIVETSTKYGTKITKTTYESGYIKYDYNFKSFNGKTADMKSEASSLVSKNSGIYQEVLKFTNGYRAEKSISPLTLDTNLSIAATIRAIEIAYANKFDHTRPNNTKCFTVLNEIGYTYSTAGENIAYGQNYSYYSPEQVTKGWRNSPGHYANMIHEDFNRLGVGYYKLGNKTYYVQMFSN